jgi:hypothetical protein
LSEGEIDAKCVFTKEYEEKCRIGAMKKQSQFKPNFRKGQNGRKYIFDKGL